MHPPPIVVTRRKIVNRDLTILGRQRDGNGYQYNRSLNYRVYQKK
jgi:hypothetical protein